MEKLELGAGVGLISPWLRTFGASMGRLLCMLLVVWGCLSPLVQAAELEPTADAIRDEVQALMSVPPFVSEETLYRWRYRGETDDVPGDDDSPDLSWLSVLLGSFSEFVLWLALVVALVLLFVYRERWLHLFQPRAKQAEVILPAALFGREEAAEPLPDDIAGSAWSLWRDDQCRRGVSLLYRGALLDLISRRHLELPASATEEDCLLMVQAVHDGELGTYFGELTRSWQHTAYAARPPEEHTMRALCEHWREHFDC